MNTITLHCITHKLHFLKTAHIKASSYGQSWYPRTDKFKLFGFFACHSLKLPSCEWLMRNLNISSPRTNGRQFYIAMGNCTQFHERWEGYIREIIFYLPPPPPPTIFPASPEVCRSLWKMVMKGVAEYWVEEPPASHFSFAVQAYVIDSILYRRNWTILGLG